MAIRYSKNSAPWGDHLYTAMGKPVDREPDPFIPHDEDDTQERPYASVTVKHTPGKFVVPYSNANDLNEDTGLSHEYLDHLRSKIYGMEPEDRSQNDREAATALSRLDSPYEGDRNWGKEVAKTNPHFKPDTLFEHIPSSITITNMMADPSMSHTAMTLAAMAKRDFKAEKIVASGDLSVHSSPLVQNAVQRGLPVETSASNPDAHVTNDVDKYTRNKRTISAKYQDNPWGLDQSDTIISPEEVKGARDDIRGWLREGRSNKVRNTKPVTSKGLSDQFLPGMEGFV